MADTPVASGAPAEFSEPVMTAEGAESTESAETKPDRHTFGAPRGTVRGLLALCVAGSAYWLIANPAVRAAHYGGLLPEDLVGALLIVLGYYFADRSSGNEPDLAAKAPMWLPEGTIRTALVMGFVASVGWLVYTAYNAAPDNFNFFALPAAGIIINISAFLAGRLGRMILKSFQSKGRSLTGHILGDVKGLIGVAAGVGTFVVYCLPDIAVYIPADWRGRFLELFPGLISFYFGTR